MEIKAMEAILSQLRATEAMANGVSATPQSQGAPGAFADTLRHAIDAVNTAQNQAGQLVSAQAAGRSQIDINQIMVALEKADLSFQAMVEVRNKLVGAYQKIMDLQV